MGAVGAVMFTIFAVAAVTSAVLGVIQAFTPPKPSKITFGFSGDQGGSPRYGSFVLDNTVSNELAVPVLYGQLKIAGNVIWQTDPAETVKRIIGLCEGLISSISDVRANDTPINDTGTPGSSYTAYLGTATQQADTRVSNNVRADLELHNLAYLALTLAVSENLKGGNPTITSVCQGLLVKTWDGSQWTTAKSYSRNPVACLRDFLISKRYGLGIDESTLNDTTFGAAYDYCEELVDSPSGKEARFRMDFIADTQRPAQDVINDMLATFSGFIVYAGSKIKLRIEKTEGVTQFFGDGSSSKANAEWDPNNIVKDSFSWNMSSVDDRPNRIKVQWVDPSQNYARVYTQVEDRIDQDDRNTVITKEIALLGVTRQTQAARMAKFFMTSQKYKRITVSFSARLESIHCEVGDVVCISHQSARFVRKLFRIAIMQEGEDETIRVTCAEYNPSIYDDHQGASILTYQQPTGPNPFQALSDVTNLALLEDNFKQKDGVFVTNILASWTPISSDQILRLDRHLLQISSDGGVNYRDVAFADARASSYRIVLGNVATGTTFLVKIKTISDKGSQSTGTTGSVTIQGKSTPPSDVEDFTVNFAFDHISMSWSAINDADLFGYEIRVGDQNSRWETASIVTTENLGTRFDLFDFSRGTKIFYIKAIDNSGNYSANAAQDSLTITSVPETNVFFTFDSFSRVTQQTHPQEGTLTTYLEKIPTNDYNPLYNRPAIQPKPTYLWNSFLTLNGTPSSDLTDSSANAFVISPTGNVAVTTAQAKLGTGSLALDGTNSALTAPDSSLWRLGGGTGDFTVEAFMRFRTLVNDSNIIAQFVDGSNFYIFRWSASNALLFIVVSSGVPTIVISNAWVPSVNTWYHVALVRSGTNFLMFIDGTQLGITQTSAVAIDDFASVLFIGGLGSNYTDGFMDELRISTVARYTSNFVPTTTEFSSDSSTSLLLHLNKTSTPTPSTWANIQSLGMVFGRESYNTTTQSYTTDVIDIGSSLTASYILDMQTYSSSNLGFISPYITTSTDGITYSTLTAFVSGIYTARYVRFVFFIQAIDPSTIVRLISAILTIDVPDIYQRFLNEAIPSGGRTFTLTGFTAVKSIVMTTVGSASQLLSPQITDQSGLPSTFTAKMFDKTDTPTAGNANIYVSGY